MCSFLLSWVDVNITYPRKVHWTFELFSRKVHITPLAFCFCSSFTVLWCIFSFEKKFLAPPFMCCCFLWLLCLVCSSGFSSINVFSSEASLLFAFRNCIYNLHVIYICMRVVCALAAKWIDSFTRCIFSEFVFLWRQLSYCCALLFQVSISIRILFFIAMSSFSEKFDFFGAYH